MVYVTDLNRQQSPSEEHIRERLQICLSQGDVFESGQASLHLFVLNLDAQYRTVLGQAQARRILDMMHATGDEIRLVGNTIYDVTSRSGNFQYALRQYIDSRGPHTSFMEDVRTVIEGVNNWVGHVMYSHDEGIRHLQAASRLRTIELSRQTDGKTITHIWWA